METDLDSDLDLLVIGGGTAGTAAAAEAVKLGHRDVLVVNDRELGGLCILEGCMPSKTLLHASGVAREARDAAALGLDVPIVGVRMADLQARRSALVERFRRAKVERVAGAGHAVENGRVRFTGPDSVVVTRPDGSERALRARAFLVATGSTAVRPDIAGLASTPYWTSREALLCDRVPATMTVVGAGAVGLEFATLFAELGCAVTLLARSAPLAAAGDPALSSAVVRALEELGVHVVVEAEVASVAHDERGFEVAYWCEGHEERLCTERLLVAAGRAPALAGLGLDAAGVELVDGRPLLDEHLCSTNRRVFFAGDAAGRHAVLHVAAEQGRHVARNLARHARGARLARWRERVPLDVVFMHPPYAACGLTEQAARAAGLDVVVATKAWSQQGRGIVRGAGPSSGFVTLVAERPSSRLVGCQILGPNADELVHVPALALHLSASARDLMAMPWYHPTLGEVFLDLARDVAEQCEVADPACVDHGA